MLFSFYSISKYLKCDISGTLCWLPSEVSIADLPSTVMSTRELCASCPSPAFNENYTRVVTAAFHVGTRPRRVQGIARTKFGAI